MFLLELLESSWSWWHTSLVRSWGWIGGAGVEWNGRVGELTLGGTTTPSYRSRQDLVRTWSGHGAGSQGFITYKMEEQFTTGKSAEQGPSTTRSRLLHTLSTIWNTTPIRLRGGEIRSRTDLTLNLCATIFRYELLGNAIGCAGSQRPGLLDHGTSEHGCMSERDR